MPANHHLDEYLEAYLEAADLRAALKSPLFRSVMGRTRLLSDNAMTQPYVYRMIRWRADHAGILTKIGCHTFRATGITLLPKSEPGQAVAYPVLKAAESAHFWHVGKGLDARP